MFFLHTTTCCMELRSVARPCVHWAAPLSISVCYKRQCMQSHYVHLNCYVLKSFGHGLEIKGMACAVREMTDRRTYCLDTCSEWQLWYNRSGIRRVTNSGHLIEKKNFKKSEIQNTLMWLSWYFTCLPCFCHSLVIFELESQWAEAESSCPSRASSKKPTAVTSEKGSFGKNRSGLECLEQVDISSHIFRVS